jgi:DNA-binding PadR family transcriptional regulator
LHDISPNDIIWFMASANDPSPSPVEFEILLALAAGQLHGYGIMQQVESRSGGVVRLGPGTLYGAIKRMTRAAWIETSEPGASDDARRRCYYRLTRAGRRAAAAAARQMADTVNIAAERGLIPKIAGH